MTNKFEPRRILVPMDGSECSVRAWQHSIAWAKATDSIAQALYVKEPFLAAKLETEQKTALKTLQDQALKRIREQIGSENTLTVKKGHAAGVIVKTSQETTSGLVIMGTHGRQGIDRAFLGSVAEKVIRHATTPILTVKTKFSPVKSILVPVNFTPYSKAAVQTAFQVARHFNADISLIHVLSGWSRLNEVSDHFDDLVLSLPRELTQGINIQRLAQSGRPIEAIVQEAQRHDLIVLSAHRKKLLKEFILGSTAERTLRYSPTPVLAIPWIERPGLSLSKKFTRS